MIPCALVRETVRTLHAVEEAAALGRYRSDLDLELDGALREARSEAWRRAGANARTPNEPPPWSARARAVLWDALITASSAEVRLMGAGHVLEASLGAADYHVQALLREHELDPERLRDAAHAAIAVENNEPWTPCAGDLWRCRVAVPIDGPGPGMQFPRLLVAYMSGNTQASPTLCCLELEAERQAVRLGHPVTTAHLVAAIVALDDQLQTVRLAFAPDHGKENRAGAALSRRGVSLDGTVRSMAGMTFDGAAVAPPDRRRRRPSRPWVPRWTVDAVEAYEQARSAGGRTSGGSHLLTAALAEGGGPAWQLLDRLGVDPRALLNEDVR